jgi:uncharacterized membrane protein
VFPFMLHLVIAAAGYEALHQFVTAYKVHPILINFTAALIPVSVISDILAGIFDKQTLRDTVPLGCFGYSSICCIWLSSRTDFSC